MKRILATALCAVMVLFNSAAVFGAEETEKTANHGEISLKLHDKYLNLDTCPVIRNGHTLVPLKAIVLTSSVVVSWSIDADGEIDMTKPVKVCTYRWANERVKLWQGEEGFACTLEIEILVGENYMYVDGEMVELDCAAEVVNGNIMVPVRPIAEAMGYKVKWDDETRSVLITR